MVRISIFDGETNTAVQAAAMPAATFWPGTTSLFKLNAWISGDHSRAVLYIFS